MTIDLSFLARKSFITLEELDNLLFHHTFEKTPRNYFGDERFNRLNQLQNKFEDLVDDALKKGDLDATNSDYCQNPRNLEFKKEVISNWLIEKDVLTWIQGKGVDIPAENINFINNSATKETEQESTPEEKEKGGQAKRKEADAEKFIRNLRVWCENDIEIKIQPQGKVHVTCNPSALGFQGDRTKEWCALIDLLNNPDGTFSYKKTERDKKGRWNRIEKKLIAYLKDKFKLDFPVGFKLFESVPGGDGIRRPLFQVKERKVEKKFDFTALDDKEVIEKLKIMARVEDPDSAEKFLALQKHAKKKCGMSDSEIDRIIDVEREFRDKTIDDRYDNLPEDSSNLE